MGKPRIICGLDEAPNEAFSEVSFRTLTRVDTEHR
jgi:hypothetical protein